MVLPSQSARPKSRTSHMYRGRRRRRTPMILILLALLIVTFGVWRFIGPGRPQTVAANTDDVTPAESVDREPELPIRIERDRKQPASRQAPFARSAA